MALTREILTANAVLSGLTDEQINAITTLSQNDENTVIGQRIGEIYRQMDATIATATGIQRNGDEKTYNYLERATAELAEKAKGVDGLNRQITDLTKEKTRLEKVIADGAGDAETRKALEQTRKDLAAVTKQFTELKTEYDSAKQQHATELFNVKIDQEIGVATAAIKFKDGFPSSVTGVLLNQAIEKVKGMNPEYIDDGKGGKVLAFKDENGAIMRNPENQLNPYTANDLITKELKGMGVLHEGRQQTGGGTQQPGGGNGGSGGTIDISGARTRVEAYDAIAASLMAQGLINGSAEFDKAMSQAWKDNNVASLPEK